MNANLHASLIAAALLVPVPGLAHEPVVRLEAPMNLAAADDSRAQADAWKRWADDFSRELRSSMGTMFGPRLSGKIVKGAPYSAEIVTESNQALADGNVISRKTGAKVYRDGQGRVRQEMPGDGKEPMVFIQDPVEGLHYILTPGARRAIVSGGTPEAMAVERAAERAQRDVERAQRDVDRANDRLQREAERSAERAKRQAERGERTSERQVIRIGDREVRIENGKVFVDGREVTGGKAEVVANGKTIRVDNGKVTIDGKPVADIPPGSDGKVDKVVVKTIEAGESPDGTRREEIRVQVVRAGDTPLAIPPAPPVPPMPPMPPGRTFDHPLLPLPPMPGVSTFRFESAGLGKGVTTSLGEKSFDGVKAEGKSTVWTIPAGEIGNRNAINVTSETWYAPDLQLTVYSRYNDPRTGESIYRLAGIRRGEPAADLFKVPGDYVVKRRNEGH